MNCRLPLLPPLPQLLVPPSPQPPSLKALWGETKRQTHKSGAGRDPTPRGATRQRWRQGRDREDGVTCDLSSQQGAPSLLLLHLGLHPAGGLGPSFCWPLSSLHLGAPVGSRAGPWWPGQNPGLEPMGAWKQPECVPGRAWLQVVGKGRRAAGGSQLCNQAALTTASPRREVR